MSEVAGRATAAQTQTMGTAAPPSGRRVRLEHRTSYRYQSPAWLSPHEIRLRPSPLARTPTTDYALTVSPASHELKWLHDAYGNWVARVIFGAPTTELTIAVTLVAELTPVNPFDFYVADRAWSFPFAYSDEERHALAPYMATEPAGERLRAWLERMRTRLLGMPLDTIEFLVALNRWVADDVGYIRREEHGIQSCEQTLARASGSCRDSAWLVAQILRHSGLASRFASGYLVQVGDSDDGAGDLLALHAWCEAFVPGAGWIGLDATSGLLATEGHIPLACAAQPSAAAAVTGRLDSAGSTPAVDMRVVRLVPPANAKGER